MGAIDHLYDIFDFSHWNMRRWRNRGSRRNWGSRWNWTSRNLKKHNQLETIEIKVKMDCEGCERRVKNSVKGMEGVTQVMVDPKHSKLTVIGYVDPKKVLKRMQLRTGKAAEFWPYIPYEAVAHPYAAGSYDKKAPAGYIRNTMENPTASKLASASSMEENYTNTFSDENPNACSLM